MKTVLEYLEAHGIDPSCSIVEIDGKVYPVGTDFGAIEYVEGSRIEAFRIVAGG